MMSARLRFAACWLLSLLWASTVFAQPGVFQAIAPGVSFRETAGGCNNTVIEMSDYLVIVDANYPGLALDLVQNIKDISAKPIKLVIDTHQPATLQPEICLVVIRSDVRLALVSVAAAKPHLATSP
jgi:hypothetical protein